MSHDKEPPEGVYGEGAAELTGHEEHNAASTKRDVSYARTTNTTYDPRDPIYWDDAALAAETARVFEICAGCRMCFKYCDSFPTLFALVDDLHGGDATKLTPRETARVFDDCFQCKLCEIECPYTPRVKHEFHLDFPKLVHRYRAVNGKKSAPSLRERLLSDPDDSARLARASLGLVNVLNRVELHRVFFEKIAGVHRKKTLPMFAQTTFTSWAKREGKVKPPNDVEAVLFQTCFVENNEPDIGKDAMFVLEKNGVRVACAEGLVCCGMPKWEHGNLDAVRAQAKKNLDVLTPYVDAGAKVLAVNPTCSMMIAKEYPELVDEEDRARAERVAAATSDPGELLWSIRKEPRFSSEWKSTPGSVAYHVPCHLRAQYRGAKGKDLVKKIPGVTVAMTQECCGHDGTYAMKTETFEKSVKIGKKSFDGMKEADATTWVTDCPLAATQFEQHAGKKALHPMTVLARAYREDGFAEKAPPATETR